MCMPYKRMSCWRFKMKNSFASGQAPAHISANMSEGGWSEKGKQETQQKKKKNWSLLASPARWTQLCWEERSILLSYWRAKPRANICAGAEGWLPSGWAGAVVSGGTQPWSRCRASSWLQRPDTLHNWRPFWILGEQDTRFFFSHNFLFVSGAVLCSSPLSLLCCLTSYNWQTVL